MLLNRSPRWPRSLWLALLTLAVPSAGLMVGTSGCDDNDRGAHDAGEDALTSVCETGYLGDPSAPAQLELRALKADGTDVPIASGDDLAILFPPQGGRVAFVGVRAKNVDGCGFQVVGAVRDPMTKQIRLDGRTVNLRRDPDGWGATGKGVSTDIESADDIGNYSNVPLCPNQWAEQDVFDQPFELEVQIEDRRGKTASAKISVTPRCAEPGAKLTSCRCLCKRGYVLGESCGEDGGSGSSNGDGGER